MEVAADESGGASGTGAADSGGGAAVGGEVGVGGAPSTGGGEGSGGTGGAPFVDPGCPDVEPPPPYYECDPLSDDEDCPEGYGCYPFVMHPFGSGCGTQQFGTRCAFAGTGEQGDRCGDSYGSCASGHLCVLGATPGKRCTKLCQLGSDHDCPAGLICGEVDIVGYGVCF